MKRLIPTLLCSLVLIGACKKEDTAPTYATFASVGSTLAVSKNGAASYNLTDLQLRITHNSTNDVYEYRGTYNNAGGVSIVFYVDPKRTSTAASWAGLTYASGFSGAQSNVEGGTAATYANPGATATGSFTGNIYRGTLR